MSTNNTTPARFKFKNYLITDASIKLTGEPISDNVQFGIEPEGKLNRSNKTFILTLRVIVKDEKKNLELNMSVKGIFEYEADNMEELLPFICTNAPAIVFPYIRAYISNITALGGMSPIILPTLNIEGVGKELKEKLSVQNNENL